MRRLLRILGWLAAVVPGLAQAGEVREFTYASAVLGRNVLYTIYRPGWIPDRERLPALYLLHGAGGDHRSFINQGQIEAVADRLIAAGQIRPLIIVMPDAGQCWWVEAPACRMETAFWTELEPQIASRDDVARGKSSRAIGGVSAGGFGAIRLALSQPSHFAAAAVLSPAVYSGIPPEYSKARSTPSFLDASGKFDEGAWRDNSYVRQLPAYAAANSPVAFRIATGDRDEFGLALEAALLHSQLQLLQKDMIELRIRGGVHAWSFWGGEIEDTLRFFDRHLGGRQRSQIQGVAAPHYGRR